MDGVSCTHHTPYTESANTSEVTPIRTYRDAARHARPDQFTAWWREMMAHGVLCHPSQDENLFVSTAHTDDDISRTLEAADASMAALVAAGAV